MIKHKRKKYLQDDIINKFKTIHPVGFTYENFIYNGIKEKGIITCIMHGDFLQSPDSHLRGNGGCKKCVYEIYSKLYKNSIETFIKKSQTIHGNEKFNYKNTIYIGVFKPVEIFCNICNEYFIQIAHDHLNGSGHKKCGIENRTKLRTKSQEKTIEDFLNKHGKEYYDYSKVVYIKNKIKIEIGCKKCNTWFWATPFNHLQGTGCPVCNFSKGEIEIKNILNEIKLIYEHQYRFDNCKNKRSLPFDFYLKTHNLCIEYDGYHHFGLTKRKNAQQILDRTTRNDKIKNEFCKENNINLLRISYKENIREKLLNFLVLKKL